jgi:hypothetical protein
MARLGKMAGKQESQMVKNLIGITHFLMESARGIGSLNEGEEPSGRASDCWRVDPSPFDPFLPLLCKG